MTPKAASLASACMPPAFLQPFIVGFGFAHRRTASVLSRPPRPRAPPPTAAAARSLASSTRRASTYGDCRIYRRPEELRGVAVPVAVSRHRGSSPSPSPRRASTAVAAPLPNAHSKSWAALDLVALAWYGVGFCFGMIRGMSLAMRILLRRLRKFLFPVPEAPEAPRQVDDEDLNLEGLFDDSDVEEGSGLPEAFDDDNVFNLQGLFALEQGFDDDQVGIHPGQVVPPGPEFQYDQNPELSYSWYISYDQYVKEGVNDHPDVIAHDSEVTFRGVRLVAPSIQLQGITAPDLMAVAHGTRENIMAVHDIINEDLFSGQPPEGIKDLLTMMKFDLHRPLHCIHGSLVPIITFSDLYRLMYDYIIHKLPKKDMRDILKHMPYVDDWVTLVEQNDLLVSTFTHSKGAYSIPTKDENNPYCLSDDQRKALRALGLHEEVGPSSYPKLAVQEFTIHGAELISYVRFIRVVGYLQLTLLPDDVLAGVLACLSPRGLAASRHRVHPSLAGTELLPFSVGDIFLTLWSIRFPPLFVPPSATMRRADDDNLGCLEGAPRDRLSHGGTSKSMDPGGIIKSHK
nr:unnamed protein product [Digitaria exilis]